MIEFIITCDGGSRGNHDKNVVSMGYGSFMIEMDGVPAASIRSGELDFGENITNNQAEYMALSASLEHISDNFAKAGGDLKAVGLKIRTDSQLVIGHLMKGHKVKHTLVDLVVKASSQLQQFDSFVFEQIPGDKMKQILGH